MTQACTRATGKCMRIHPAAPLPMAESRRTEPAAARVRGLPRLRPGGSRAGRCVDPAESDLRRLRSLRGLLPPEDSRFRLRSLRAFAGIRILVPALHPADARHPARCPDGVQSLRGRSFRRGRRGAGRIRCLAQVLIRSLGEALAVPLGGNHPDPVRDHQPIGRLGERVRLGLPDRRRHLPENWSSANTGQGSTNEFVTPEITWGHMYLETFECSYLHVQLAWTELSGIGRGPHERGRPSAAP